MNFSALLQKQAVINEIFLVSVLISRQKKTNKKQTEKKQKQSKKTKYCDRLNLHFLFLIF